MSRDLTQQQQQNGIDSAWQNLTADDQDVVRGAHLAALRVWCEIAANTDLDVMWQYDSGHLAIHVRHVRHRDAVRAGLAR